MTGKLNWYRNEEFYRNDFQFQIHCCSYRCLTPDETFFMEPTSSHPVCKTGNVNGLYLVIFFLIHFTTNLSNYLSVQKFIIMSGDEVIKGFFTISM